MSAASLAGLAELHISVISLISLMLPIRQECFFSAVVILHLLLSHPPVFMVMPSGLEPKPAKVKKEVRLVLLIKLFCSDTVIHFELTTCRLSYKNPPLETKSAKMRETFKIDFKSDLQAV